MEKRTDLRVEKTYMMLRNAFTQLLEERRFEDITVNELCERAMIRRTTFYKHFADKYEYLAFYMKEICAGFRDQLPPDVLTDDVNVYFLHMSRELLRFIDRHEKLVRNVADSSLSSVLMDSLSEHIMMDVLQILQRMQSSAAMSRSRMEGLAAFYSGGLLNTLRLFLKRGLPIDEEPFMWIISDFLNQKVYTMK